MKIKNIELCFMLSEFIDVIEYSPNTQVAKLVSIYPINMYRSLCDDCMARVNT